MDFTIPQEEPVSSAIKRFTAFNIGALVTTDESGKIAGVFTERDYIKKVAIQGKSSEDFLIKDVQTNSASLVTAKLQDSVDECMEKMLENNIRHLPLLDDEGHVVGILSVKDLIKEMMAEREGTIQMLENFASGKGGTVEYV